jgi:hypothetical protein
MMWYTLGQCVFLYDTYVKYGSARKYRRKFRDERVFSTQIIHIFVKTVRTAGLFIDKKQQHKRRVLTEKLDDIGARLEHTPRKTLKRLAQETGVSKCCARTTTQLLKVRPYKTIIHARIAAARSR